MKITYRLQVFEGPLDLLLHLIDINKIDIYDIPITMITDQYLEYIQEMQLEDMDVTSDFLVMAATLLRIKSQMMLPVEVREAETSGQDPRAELVQRLLEYKMYKYIGQELKDRAILESRAVFKGKTIPSDMIYEEPPVDLDALVGDMNIVKLGQIYQAVIKKQADKIDPIRSRYGKIEQEPVRLIDKMSWLRTLVSHSDDHVSFRRILEDAQSKEEVIVTFLAVLELVKDGSVVIEQEKLFDDILIRVGVTPEGNGETDVEELI